MPVTVPPPAGTILTNSRFATGGVSIVEWPEYHPPMPRGSQHDSDFDATRMTVGEHLDELRGCVVRSLVALIVACVLLIWPAKYILELTVRPVVLALRRHGQPENLLQTSPTELMVIYLKVILISGMVVASPYILHQFWSFVGSGLYPREKNWIKRLLPFSVGLFLVGVAFMYSLVLLVSLNFLVGFSGWIGLPEPHPGVIERALLRTPAIEVPADQPEVGDAPQIPLLADDPTAPPIGRVWFNYTEHKLKLRLPDQTYSVPLVADEKRPIVTTFFKIGDYLTFVLTMTIAFGVAFQMPLVVMAVVRIGLVSIQTLRKSRRYVLFVILIVAGILAPPEIISHLLLAGPMIILFETGLLLAGRHAARAKPAK